MKVLYVSNVYPVHETLSISENACLINHILRKTKFLKDNFGL